VPRLTVAALVEIGEQVEAIVQPGGSGATYYGASGKRRNGPPSGRRPGAENSLRAASKHPAAQTIPPSGWGAPGVGAVGYTDGTGNVGVRCSHRRPFGRSKTSTPRLVLSAVLRGTPNSTAVGEFLPEQCLRLEGLLKNVGLNDWPNRLD
jgi:hypothetical protein